MEMKSEKPTALTKTCSGATLSTTYRTRTGSRRRRHGTVRRHKNCKVTQFLVNTTQTFQLLPLTITMTHVF
jgi:seryl-tRNA synthetase